MKENRMIKTRLLTAVICIAASASGIYAQQGGTTQQMPSSTKGAVIKGKAPVNQKVLLTRADSAWQAGSYLLATSLYETAVARDPSANLAIFRLTTLRSWDNRLDEALERLRKLSF